MFPSLVGRGRISALHVLTEDALHHGRIGLGVELLILHLALDVDQRGAVAALVGRRTSGNLHVTDLCVGVRREDRPFVGAGVERGGALGERALADLCAPVEVGETCD